MSENGPITKPFTALLIAAFLLFALSSCGIRAQGARVDDDSDYRPETVIVYRDSTERQGEIVERSDPADDADENMRLGAQLPDDFPVPIPEDYEVRAVGTAGNETSAVLEVPSGGDAYNYYLQALANAGFEVVDEGRNQSGYFDAEIEFSSSNVEGNLEFSGDTVEVDVESYE